MEETNETLQLVIGNLETALNKMKNSEGFATSLAFGAYATSFSQYAEIMKEILESLKPRPVQGEKVCANCRYCYPTLITINGELKGGDVCTHPRIKKATGGMGSSIVVENSKEVGCEKWKKERE